MLGVHYAHQAAFLRKIFTEKITRNNDILNTTNKRLFINQKNIKLRRKKL